MTRVILLIAIILAAQPYCVAQPDPDPSGLVAADEAFSRMSLEKGLNEAFIFFAADSVIKMREGLFPVTGKAEMTRLYRERPDTGMILTWKPQRAEVSRSGELGYTFGDWQLRMKSADTTLYGNYISVWKKQPDGTWKYILDAGCNTPKPPDPSLKK